MDGRDETLSSFSQSETRAWLRVKKVAAMFILFLEGEGE
jgi:hypothetical protein